MAEILFHRGEKIVPPWWLYRQHLGHRLLDAGRDALGQPHRFTEYPGQSMGRLAYRSTGIDSIVYFANKVEKAGCGRKILRSSGRHRAAGTDSCGPSFFKRERRFRMAKYKKILCVFVMVLLMAVLFSTTAFAAGTGDVAGAIESTWTDAADQIKAVVNNVVFPVIDLILAVFFFAKLGMAYFDYRKHGQFEWTAPAILFACLIFTLTAPTYVWSILGM